MNKLKCNLELSSKGRNTKIDLVLQQGPQCCAPHNIVVMGNISVLKLEFTLRSRSWTAVITAGFKGDYKGGKYSARQWFLHSSPLIPSLSFPAQLRKGRREMKWVPHGDLHVPARTLSWDSGSSAEEATWGCICRDRCQQIVAGPACVLRCFQSWSQNWGAVVQLTQPVSSSQLPPNTDFFFWELVTWGKRKMILKNP